MIEILSQHTLASSEWVQIPVASDGVLVLRDSDVTRLNWSGAPGVAFERFATGAYVMTRYSLDWPGTGRKRLWVDGSALVCCVKGLHQTKPIAANTDGLCVAYSAGSITARRNRPPNTTGLHFTLAEMPQVYGRLLVISSGPERGVVSVAAPSDKTLGYMEDYELHVAHYGDDSRWVDSFELLELTDIDNTEAEALADIIVDEWWVDDPDIPGEFVKRYNIRHPSKAAIDLDAVANVRTRKDRRAAAKKTQRYYHDRNRKSYLVERS